MNKYNVGDEFIIRIGSTYYCDDNFYAGARMIEQDPLYLIEGFNALVFDESGLDRLQSLSAKESEMLKDERMAGYRKGVEETWNLILYVLNHTPQVREYIFGYHNMIDIMNHFGMEEVKRMCDRYHSERDFAPGDEVADVGNHEEVYVIMAVDRSLPEAEAYDRKTCEFVTLTNLDNYKKTGRHFSQVDALLTVFRSIQNLDDRIAEGAPVDKEVQ